MFKIKEGNGDAVEDATDQMYAYEWIVGDKLSRKLEWELTEKWCW